MGTKLVDRIRQEVRLRGLRPATAEVYWRWTAAFVRFHGLTHPRELGAAEVERFLMDVAVRQSASSVNQAHAALLFLYRHVLRQVPAGLEELPWALGIRPGSGCALTRPGAAVAGVCGSQASTALRVAVWIGASSGGRSGLAHQGPGCARGSAHGTRGEGWPRPCRPDAAGPARRPCDPPRAAACSPSPRGARRSGVGGATRDHGTSVPQGRTDLALAVGLPSRSTAVVVGQPTGAAPCAPVHHPARLGHGRPTRTHPEARSPPCASPLLCDPLLGGRRQHPRAAGASGPCRHSHDLDLHPRHDLRRPGGDESSGSLVAEGRRIASHCHHRPRSAAPEDRRAMQPPADEPPPATLDERHCACGARRWTYGRMRRKTARARTHIELLLARCDMKLDRRERSEVRTCPGHTLRDGAPRQ